MSKHLVLYSEGLNTFLNFLLF